jgi:hypothetical protein
MRNRPANKTPYLPEPTYVPRHGMARRESHTLLNGETIYMVAARMAERRKPRTTLTGSLSYNG